MTSLPTDLQCVEVNNKVVKKMSGIRQVKMGVYDSY